MKRSRVSLILTTILVVLVVGTIVGPRIFFLAWVKSQANSEPAMWEVPTPLADASVNQAPGKNLVYFGYEFELPWTDVNFEKAGKEIAILGFAGGAKIVFWNPAGSLDVVELMKKEAAKRGADATVLYGADAIRSNFALRSKMLHLTPRDLSFLTLRPEATGNAILLMLKPLNLSKRSGGLYSFQTGSLRGFQHGSPAKDELVDIDAFDTQDREIKLQIGSSKGANGISQADVNRILFSLRPVAALPTAGCAGATDRKNDCF